MVIKKYIPQLAPGMISTWPSIIITSLLLLILFTIQGCAPAKLTHVLIDERPASQSEYYKVQVFHKDKPVETKQNLELQKESTLETDSQSWAVLYFSSSKTKVILKPGTRIRIASFHLIFGEILAIIDKLSDGKDAFSVQTEDTSATPHKTVFAVRKDKNGPTVVSVIEGRVKLTSPAAAWKPVMINQFQQATASRLQSPSVSTLPGTAFNPIIAWGNRVELATSHADARVMVPQIRSMDQNKAEQVLQDIGLRVGKVTATVTDSRPPIGTVVKQDPLPGVRVGRGSMVNISVEAKPVKVPSLQNKPLSRAKSILIQKGLTLGDVDRRITGNAPAETVIDQQPPSGTIVPEGDSVHVVVEEESVLIPDLQRLHRDQATSSLANSRLTVGSVEERITGTQPVHAVLQQDPGANTRVRPGTSVNLVIEAESVMVPNIVGSPKDNAISTLNQNRLVHGQIVETITGQQSAGTVLSQQPSAGERVKPQTSVRMEIEAHSTLIPNLQNVHRNTAQNTLSQHNLQIGQVSEELRDNVGDGVILHQSPRAGQRVALQTPVNITVAVRGVRVPRLSGQHNKNVGSVLGQYSLRLGAISNRETDRYNWDKVIDQSPPPNSLVKLNTVVNIVIGIQKKCTVPNVVGINAVSADNAIRGAGLSPYNNGPGQGTGTVVTSQNPGTGQRVNCGSGVSYSASLRAKPQLPTPLYQPVIVPNLRVITPQVDIK